MNTKELIDWTSKVLKTVTEALEKGNKEAITKTLEDWVKQLNDFKESVEKTEVKKTEEETEIKKTLSEIQKTMETMKENMEKNSEKVEKLEETVNENKEKVEKLENTPASSKQVNKTSSEDSVWWEFD